MIEQLEDKRAKGEKALFEQVNLFTPSWFI